MSERSLAEIIGLEFYPWNGPTVDDLIVWLADRDWFPYELYPDPCFALESFDVYLRHISVPYADAATCDAWSKVFIQVGGPTLLAALEAAVRAVDSQSSLTDAPVAAGGEVESAAPPVQPTSDTAPAEAP